MAVHFVRESSSCQGRSASGRSCDHLWHTHSFRQHGRANAQFSGSNWPAMAQGRPRGQVGSVFASTGTQHGGQETTITSFHSTLLHQGMIIVGVPYTEPGLTYMGEISGGTPYGATTMAGTDGSRQPTENELKIARYQGKHVVEIT